VPAAITASSATTNPVFSTSVRRRRQNARRDFFKLELGISL
jgi:hypothetical protein